MTPKLPTSRLYKSPKAPLFPYKKNQRRPRKRQIDHRLQISSLLKVWNRFRYLAYPKVAILRGNLCQSSRRFRPRTNGRQDAANCTVAVIFAKMFKMADWNEAYIDKILLIGDELITLSLMYKPHLRFSVATPKDLYNNIYIDDIKVTFTVEGDVATGKLYPQDSIGDVPDLKTALTEYLSVHDTVICGVLTMMVAFWKKEGYYYYFDPHERDETGIAIRNQNGRACVMRFTDIKNMVNAFCANVDRSKNFKFRLIPVNILRMSKVRLEPPTIPVRVPLNLQLPEEDTITPVLEVKLLPKPDPIPPVEPDPTFNEYYEMNPNFLRTNSKIALTDEQRKLLDLTVKAKSSEELTVIPSVSYFETISPLSGILRATIFKLPELAPSISLYALGMLKIYKSKVWTTEIVDQILHYGHKLYKQSFYKLGNSGDKSIILKDVVKDFIIFERKFSAEVQHSSIIGMLNSDQLDFAQGVVDFFREYDTGIIQGPITVAIWQEEDLYYMLDSYECNEIGAHIIPKDGESSGDGKSCVTWYKFLSDLIKTYCENLPKEHRHDPFMISNVLVTDYVEVPLPWCLFIGTKPGKWILRAQFSQNSSRFAEDNRNNQCTAMAAMAITFRVLYAIEDWNSDILDNILLEGDEFYTLTTQQLKTTKKFKHPHLTLNELSRNYTLCSVSGKHSGKRINYDIRECVVNGVITARDEDEPFNLHQGLEEYFKENDVGIITAGNISVAVWKYNNFYYYFDSHTRDHNGITHGIGVACVLRLEKMEDLVKSFVTNLQPVAEDLFNIGYCEANVWESDESGVIKPPLHHYRRINDQSAILQATHHEGNKRYYENAYHQSLSNCLVAHAMMKIMPSALWTVTVMDEILNQGDKLHTKAYLKALELDRNFEDELTLEQCEKAFRFGDYFVNIHTGTIITGHYEDSKGNNTVYDTFLEYFQQQDDPEKPDLYKCAIFESAFQVIAVWVDLGVMYIFDPSNRDIEGFNFDRDLWSLKHIIHDQLGEGEGEGGNPMRYEQPEEESETEESVKLESEDSLPVVPVAHPEGQAYCRWFTTLGTFGQHIIDNAPPNQLQDTQYTITPLMVQIKRLEKERPALPEGELPVDVEPEPDHSYQGNWYNYLEIEYGYWIVRGTHCQGDIRFPEMNRGTQDAAMAMSFFIFQHSVEPKDFKSRTIDSILKYGDKLHTYCLQKGRKPPLAPSDIFTEYVLGDYTYKITLQGKVAEGDLFSTEEAILNLQNAILNISATAKRLIITTKERSFAVFKGEKMFYLFDPHCRGPNGLATTTGTACLLRFLNLEKLVDVMKANLPIEGSSRFYIDTIESTKEQIIKESKIGHAKIPELLPEPTAFVTISPGKIIVCGTMSQEDERFGRDPNAQSIACALTALGMASIHRTDIWTKEIIDEIVINGDRLYAASVDQLGFDFNPWEELLSLKKCNHNFYLGVNEINIEVIDKSEIVGILDTKNLEETNLRRGIECFFAGPQLRRGVLVNSDYMVAIWKYDTYMYLFDSGPRGPTGIATPNGVSCIMGFHDAQTMAQQCLINIPKEKHNTEFIITAVDVQIIKPRNPRCKISEIPLSKVRTPRTKRFKKVPKNWVTLTCNNNNTSLLFANCNLTSSKFSVLSRGYQAVAMAIVSIVMFNLNDPSTWNSDTLTSIIESGDQLYKDSYLKYRPPVRELELNMILRRFYVDKYCVELLIFKPTVVGNLNDIDIANGVYNFCLQEKAGIFKARKLTVAVFHKAGLFFVFDPHGRSLKSGDVDEEDGKAVLYRFKDVADLGSRIMKNLEGDDDPGMEYELCAVQIKDIIYFE